jgi:hypothetical protein
MVARHTRPSTGMWFFLLKRPIATTAATTAPRTPVVIRSDEGLMFETQSVKPKLCNWIMLGEAAALGGRGETIKISNL